MNVGIFKNLSIGTRLSFGFGLVFVLFCTLTLLAINRMEYLANNASQIHNHPLTVSNAVLKVEEDIAKMHSGMKSIVLDEHPAEINRDFRSVDALEIDAYANFEIISKWFLGDRALFEAARGNFVAWKPVRDKVIELMHAGKRVEAAAMIRGKGARDVFKIENSMHRLNAFAQSKADEYVAGAAKTTAQSAHSMYLLLFVIVVAMMVFIFFLTRSITRPLTALRAASVKIGEGKLDAPLGVDAGGEIGELARSFRNMADNLGTITASRDDLNQEIIERKAAERAREKLMAELEGKAAEMERFVYTVSHDLKSPLITIQGFIGMLEKDAMQGETTRLHGDVAHIQKAAGQMQELLGDLLEISRIGRMVNPPEKVSFNELAREAVGLLGGQIKASGAQIDIASDLPILYGDRNRLLEVVQNLMDNALKFMGEQLKPHIEIGFRRQGEESICYVKDNGIGIEPRFHKKVFELFERLDPKVDGTGIGLAIVKRIIDLDGGRIWIESAGQGRGCSFCFTLPIEELRIEN